MLLKAPGGSLFVSNRAQFGAIENCDYVEQTQHEDVSSSLPFSSHLPSLQWQYPQQNYQLT